MNKKIFLLFLLLIFAGNLAAQDKPDTAAIKGQLKLIFDRDQKARNNDDSAAFIRYIDSTNLVVVESLIKKYGWPGKSFVGERGNQAVFLVNQHADIKTQEKYLSL